LASITAQPLAGTEGAAYPFWSPDNRSIGFFADGTLKRLDIGGVPQTLATAVPRGGTWNADGVILFPPTTGGPLFRVAASGGEAVALTKLDRQTSHRFPFFLPDGRQFLFYALGTPESGGIYLGSLDSAESSRLAQADMAGVYLSSGWLLWVRAGTLVAQRLDLDRKALTGDPVTLADAVAFDTNSYASAVSVSASGLVAYRTGGASRRRRGSTAPERHWARWVRRMKMISTTPAFRPMAGGWRCTARCRATPTSGFWTEPARAGSRSMEHWLRRVDLSRQLRAELRLWRRRQRAAWLKFGQPFPEWVFPSVTGTGLDESNVRKAFNRILDAAGLHRRGPHQLRHSFASLLLQEGAPITYVSQQLGHRDASITLRVYAHWLQTSRRCARSICSTTRNHPQPRRNQGRNPLSGRAA
jgi:hypothetical protein